MTGIKQIVIMISRMLASRIHQNVYDFSVLIRNVFSEKCQTCLVQQDGLCNHLTWNFVLPYHQKYNVL